MRHYILLALAVAIVGISVSEACSCMPTHPQTQYCSADYVIIAKVVRKSVDRTYLMPRNAYKIIIKKEFKMSPKAKQDLSKGRIYTGTEESMCGLSLEVGKAYIIMGKTTTVNLCSFVKEYSKATIVERRGIAGAYRRGCACDVMPCFREGACEHVEGECLWNPYSECQTRFGSCIPSRGQFNAAGRPTKCRWRKSSPFLTCLNKSLNHV